MNGRCLCTAYLRYTRMLYGSACGGSIFCRETLAPAISADVTLTRTTYLSAVAHHVHTFLETQSLMTVAYSSG